MGDVNVSENSLWCVGFNDPKYFYECVSKSSRIFAAQKWGRSETLYEQVEKQWKVALLWYRQLAEAMCQKEAEGIPWNFAIVTNEAQDCGGDLNGGKSRRRTGFISDSPIWNWRRAHGGGSKQDKMHFYI